jgi:hypothetical protein
MIKLAIRAREAFGWEWLADHYDLTVTTQLHKDLEHSIGQLGFNQIPEEYDELLYDLHHCLHAIQGGKTTVDRWDNFQIEWMTDNSIPLPKSFEFTESSCYGDLILINPYVGHNPLQIYKENDFDSLSSTCRFHDIIKPGIVITGNQYTTKDEIVDKFIEQDPNFVQLHGEDKIRYYAGVARCGRVVDIKQYTQVHQFPGQLSLDRVEFHD